MFRGDRAHGVTASRVVAVITAYHPEPAFVHVVESLLPQVSRVIVVDNTPAGRPGATDLVGAVDRVELLGDGVNRGLARALAAGIAAAAPSEFVLLLDQDSLVGAGLVAALVELLDDDPRRAVASPTPWDAAENRYLDPRASSRPEVAEMTVVITSAMLLRRSAYAQTSGMREEFFVDGVDQDLCLQLRSAGWTIVQDRRLLLPHALGDTTWHRVGPLRMRATHHPTWRLYWAARNSTVLGLEYARREPRWSATNGLILVYWMATVLAFEPPRFRRLATMFRGVLDGLRHRSDARFLPGSA